MAKSGLMIALTAASPQTAIAGAVFDLSTRYITNQSEQDRFAQAAQNASSSFAPKSGNKVSKLCNEMDV